MSDTEREAEEEGGSASGDEGESGGAGKAKGSKSKKKAKCINLKRSKGAHGKFWHWTFVLALVSWLVSSAYFVGNVMEFGDIGFNKPSTWLEFIDPIATAFFLVFALAQLTAWIWPRRIRAKPGDDANNLPVPVYEPNHYYPYIAVPYFGLLTAGLHISLTYLQWQRFGDNLNTSDFPVLTPPAVNYNPAIARSDWHTINALACVGYAFAFLAMAAVFLHELGPLYNMRYLLVQQQRRGGPPVTRAVKA